MTRCPRLIGLVGVIALTLLGCDADEGDGADRASVDRPRSLDGSASHGPESAPEPEAPSEPADPGWCLPEEGDLLAYTVFTSPELPNSENTDYEALTAVYSDGLMVVRTPGWGSPDRYDADITSPDALAELIERICDPDVQDLPDEIGHVANDPPDWSGETDTVLGMPRGGEMGEVRLLGLDRSQVSSPPFNDIEHLIENLAEAAMARSDESTLTPERPMPTAVGSVLTEG